MSEPLPARSKGVELLQRTAEAGANFVPVVGAAFAVALVTAMDWKLSDRRDMWLQDLADQLEDLSGRADGLSPEQLVENPVFVDTMVSAAVSAQRTSHEEKLRALRNAVLNTALASDPDTDATAILMGMVDRFTPSHLRFLALWDDPHGWFAAHDDLAPPPRLCPAAGC